MGEDATTTEFVRPDRAEAFDEVWASVGVTSSSMDTHVAIAPAQDRSRAELLTELEGRAAEA